MLWVLPPIAAHSQSAPSARFNSQQTVANFDRARSVATADFSNNGNPDVLYAGDQSDGPGLVWKENKSKEGFGPSQVIDGYLGYNPSIATADFDSDGRSDIVVGDISNIYWYKNADGEFSKSRPFYPSCVGSRSVATADVDSDGDPDIIDICEGTVGWYENKIGEDSGYRFSDSNRKTVATGLGNTATLAAGDLDEDGDIDIVYANGPGADEKKIAWLENKAQEGALDLVSQEETIFADAARSVAVADLDLDGNLDVLSASGSSDTIAWYRNQISSGKVTGDGFGGQRVITSKSSFPYGITAADLDGDSDQDVLSALIGNYEIVWHQNSDLIYVNANASTGVENGEWWSTAFTDLQNALATATNDDTIWVADGTYTPGKSRENNFTVTGEKDGIKLYGGFAGGESSLSERNPVSNPTVLSGDIDGDGTPSGNSYHVLSFDGTGAKNVTSKTLLDGFTVTGGNANGTFPDNSGGGLFCDGTGSGNSCNPTLRDLTFIANQATNGGAIYNDGSSSGASSPKLYNVIFARNAATNGGALYNGGNGGTSSPQIASAVFADNNADIGGAIYNDGSSSGTSSPQIINATFSRNEASDQGGALYNFGNFGVSNPTIKNTILWGNTASNEGAEIYNEVATPVLKRSVIEGGVSGSGVGGNANTDNGGNRSGDPLFATPNDLDGPDDRFGTSDDGLSLSDGSPAIDAGSGGALPSGITTDPAGDPRVQNGSVDIGGYEGIVNPVPIHYVDKSASGGSQTGTSWEDAFTDLQDAFAAATARDTIWIAAGTYTPGTSRDASFTVTGAQDGLKIYGGFAGGETSLSERDPEANKVILSGDLNGDDQDTDGDGFADANRSENSYHVLFFDGTEGGGITEATVLNGVTITGGYANGSAPNNRGGGLYCDAINGRCSPTIGSVSFLQNEASYGGGLFNDGRSGGDASPMLEDVVFRHNAASIRGGAIYGKAAGTNGSTDLVIMEATFYANEAAEYGGAIHNETNGRGGQIPPERPTASPVIINSTFQSNRAGLGGGAMANSAGFSFTRVNPRVINSVFVSNSLESTLSPSGSSPKGGGAIYNKGGGEANGIARPRITNSTFTKNSASSSATGGAFYNTTAGSRGISNPRIRNSILWSNGNTEIAGKSATLHHTIIDGGVGSNNDGGDNLDADPLFVNFSDLDGSDNILGTDDDGLRVETGSPAIDAGDKGYLPSDSYDINDNGDTSEQLPIDLAGNTRRQDIGNVVPNGDFPVDMGAYERKGLPLPVELVTFDARTSGEAALLTWTTASETNNAGFAVQHRVDTTASWKELSFVESKAQGGTTTEEKQYRYETGALKVGTHQFRLKQVDTDGTEHLSETIRASVRMQEAYRLSTYPNPVSQRATVEVTAREAQEVTVRLYDVLGRAVATLHDGPVPAQEIKQLTLQAKEQGLSSGAYFLRLVGENGTRTSRITVVR